ncbi:hypothetical protein FVE85_5430 [Porphyridium purpureum]|uniref:Uncharacterized protein n=1 Tax=Porphyridium purpureum TaxID=35688 RepID=A0A5J4Z3H4_PORPP|nr:hypothetical protein FVE85_5430 [Porphyridium purpureum]|eukprot:POR4922..scf295_1
MAISSARRPGHLPGAHRQDAARLPPVHGIGKPSAPTRGLMRTTVRRCGMADFARSQLDAFVAQRIKGAAKNAILNQEKERELAEKWQRQSQSTHQVGSEGQDEPAWTVNSDVEMAQQQQPEEKPGEASAAKQVADAKAVSAAKKPVVQQRKRHQNIRSRTGGMADFARSQLDAYISTRMAVLPSSSQKKSSGRTESASEASSSDPTLTNDPAKSLWQRMSIEKTRADVVRPAGLSSVARRLNFDSAETAQSGEVDSAKADDQDSRILARPVVLAEADGATRQGDPNRVMIGRLLEFVRESISAEERKKK